MPLKIDFATLFPALCREVLGTSILGRAQAAGVVDVGLYDIRDFTRDRHRSADDRPYGGGPGMLLKPGPVVRCVERVLERRGPGRVVLLCPTGRRFDQSVAREFAQLDHLVFVCGHYEGFDERIRTLLRPDEISLGDFVVTGGEMPALVVADAVVRLLPGALGDPTSAESESFCEEGLLEGAQYTRPPEFRGLAVPEVLLSGDHGRIERWRREKSLERTATRERRGTRSPDPDNSETTKKPAGGDTP